MERFLNSNPQTFAKTKTVEFLTAPQLCHHQLDLGLATAGTISVFVDFGTGYKATAHTVVDMATHKAPVQIEGIVKSFKLVPDGDVSAAGYSVSYSVGAYS
ncbi:MAG: hypothetical protein V3573_14490 [Desulfovibrionaceae bacterium]